RVLHLVIGPRLTALTGILGLMEPDKPSGQFTQSRMFFDLLNNSARLVQSPVAEESLCEVTPCLREVGWLPIEEDPLGTAKQLLPSCLAGDHPRPRQRVEDHDSSDRADQFRV